MVRGYVLGAWLPTFKCQLTPDSLGDLGQVPSLHNSRSTSSLKSGIVVVPSPKVAVRLRGVKMCKALRTPFDTWSSLVAQVLGLALARRWGPFVNNSLWFSRVAPRHCISEHQTAATTRESCLLYLFCLSDSAWAPGHRILL